MGNGSFGLHYLPLAVFIIFPLTFVATYSVAVKLDHIVPFFSYISDTGTFAPEMCIFGVGLSLAMVLGKFVIKKYAMPLQIEKLQLKIHIFFNLQWAL